MEMIELLAAGLPVRLSLRCAQTWRYFQDFRLSPASGSSFPSSSWLVLPPVDEAALEQEQKRLGSDPAFAEYSLLIESFGNPVLRFRRFLFHGVAIGWRGKAWILTGKSGVGKTTQLRHWMNLYGDEIRLISGDKALIEDRDDGLWVHPSPWTGKEGEHGSGCAALGGIVLLEQGTENSMQRLSPAEAVFPLFLQFLYRPLDRESVDLVCGYEESLLGSIPIWKLVNRGDESSAKLCHDFLLKEDGECATASGTASS